MKMASRIGTVGTCLGIALVLGFATSPVRGGDGESNVQVYTIDVTAEFDHVSIRVGGNN